MDRQKYNNLIAHLAAGEDPHQLIREGHPKSTVNYLPDRGVEGRNHPSTPRCYVRDTTTTGLRLTQEQMVSPEPLWSRTLARL